MVDIDANLLAAPIGLSQVDRITKKRDIIVNTESHKLKDRARTKYRLVACNELNEKMVSLYAGSVINSSSKVTDCGDGGLVDREKYLKIIIQKLSTIAFRVGLHNSIGFTDINLSSEDFFKDLLNLIYGWDLKNLNVGSTTTPAIDLGDEDRKIFVQVTSERKRQKVVDTLTGFQQLYPSDRYVKVVMMLLREKPEFRPKTFKEADVTGVDLEIKDPYDLITEIKNYSLSDIKKISDFMIANVSASESDGEGLDRYFILDYARHLIDEYKTDTAQEMLDKMRNVSWSRMAPHEKYRVLNLSTAAHLAKGQYEEGGRLLVEAFQYNPTDDRALGNYAQGLLMLRQEDKAIEAAKNLLAANPVDGVALSVLIRVAENVAAVDAIVSSLPDIVVKDAAIQRALYAMFSSFGDSDRAIEAAENLLKSESERSCDSLANLGSEILIKLGKTPGLSIACRAAEAESIKHLNVALSLFDEAIDKIADKEIEKYKMYFYVNRSSVCLLLGMDKMALEDLEYVIRRSPKHFGARRQLGMIYSKKEANLEKAIRCLKPFSETLEDLSGTIMLAITLAQAGREEEAIHLLSLVESAGDFDRAFEATFIKADILIDSERFSEAEDTIKSLGSSKKACATALYLRAKSFRLRGDFVKAAESIRQFDREEIVTVGDQILYKIADETYKCNLYENAAPLFRYLVAGNPYNPHALSWLECLYMTGKYEDALHVSPLIVEAHPKAYMPVQVIMAVYESMGDLGPARKACSDFLRRRSDAAFAKVDLARLEWRAGNLDLVDRILDDIDWGGLSVAVIFRIVVA